MVLHTVEESVQVRLAVCLCTVTHFYDLNLSSSKQTKQSI